jgi:hypothetical protein
MLVMLIQFGHGRNILGLSFGKFIAKYYGDGLALPNVLAQFRPNAPHDAAN